MAGERELDFAPGRYFVAIWFACDETKDVLASLVRQADGTHLLRWRFRYYAPDDGRENAFDGRDRKSHWQGVFPRSMSEELAVDAVDLTLEQVFDLAEFPEDMRWKVMIQTDDGRAIFEKIRDLPFMNIRAAGAPDA